MSEQEKEILEEKVEEEVEAEVAQTKEEEVVQEEQEKETMDQFMAIGSGPIVTMKKLIEAGAHFGHNTKKWDPRMAEYIFTARHGIYIIDLGKTVTKIEEAYAAIRKIVADGGKILFVATAEHNYSIVREEALRCGSFYVTNRWLGGTLTNFKTIQKRIKYLQQLKEMSDDGTLDQMTKKEAAKIRKTINKLESNLGGIKEMRKVPNALFVIDPSAEEIAVKEARKLRIPVFGICDTNANPAMLDFVIPANDNSIKTVRLITQLIADAVIEGRGSSEIIAAYSKADDEEVSMVDALKSVDLYEEKRVQLAALNAQKKDGYRGKKKPYRPRVREEEVVVVKEEPAKSDVDVETEMAIKEVEGEG